MNISAATTFANKAIQSVGNVVNRVPVMGRMHQWTVDRVSTSEIAKKILKRVIYFSLIMIALVVCTGLVFVYKGKLDLVAGTFLGGVLTMFSGILAIALPAFVSALSASQTPTPPPPTP